MKRYFGYIFLLFLIPVAGFISVTPSEAFAPEKAKAALGKKLFNEKILSRDSSVSCASCHNPEFAFADTSAFSMGIKGTPSRRNTPSVLNMKNRPYFFWDGRAESLEKQALMPIENPDEMGLPIQEAVNRLNTSKEYVALFRKVFKQAPNAANLAAAFSAFEKTLETTNSRFDDWSNNAGKLTEEEENGRQLFVGKAGCFDCHFMEDFTDDEFRNIGLYNGKEFNDPGRYAISGKPQDMGKFKTPGLRNVEVTPPYMHNGMLRTLEEVIDYYDDPRKFISDGINIDPELKFPLQLSSKEKKELIAFLKTLTDRAFDRSVSADKK